MRYFRLFWIHIHKRIKTKRGQIQVFGSAYRLLHHYLLLPGLLYTQNLIFFTYMVSIIKMKSFFVSYARLQNQLNYNLLIIPVQRVFKSQDPYHRTRSLFQNRCHMNLVEGSGGLKDGSFLRSLLINHAYLSLLFIYALIRCIQFL